MTNPELQRTDLQPPPELTLGERVAADLGPVERLQRRDALWREANAQTPQGTMAADVIEGLYANERPTDLRRVAAAQYATWGMQELRELRLELSVRLFSTPHGSITDVELIADKLFAVREAIRQRGAGIYGTPRTPDPTPTYGGLRERGEGDYTPTDTTNEAIQRAAEYLAEDTGPDEGPDVELLHRVLQGLKKL